MKKNIKIVILLLIIILVAFAIYSYSTKDYREKKKLVEKDEQEYGEDYAVFKKEVYKESPNRIIVKKENTTNEFYIFEKNNEEYDHLLKVTLDKMYFVSNQDFNLWAFTPYSINDISNSNENFIVFDYNEDLKILIGNRTKKVYKIGDKVKIRVIFANKLLRRIDFELVNEKEREENE